MLIEEHRQILHQWALHSNVTYAIFTFIPTCRLKKCKIKNLLFATKELDRIKTKNSVNLYSDLVLYIYSDKQFNGVVLFVRVILPYSCNLIRTVSVSTLMFSNLILMLTFLPTEWAYWLCFQNRLSMFAWLPCFMLNCPRLFIIYTP